MTGDAEALNFYGQLHTMEGLKFRDLTVDGCLFTGEPNYHEALKWFIQATKAGHTGSLYNVAQLYEGGRIGDKNLTKAVSLYKEVGSIDTDTQINKYAGAKLRIRASQSPFTRIGKGKFIVVCTESDRT